jgi:hypothetical protein
MDRDESNVVVSSTYHGRKHHDWKVTREIYEIAALTTMRVREENEKPYDCTCHPFQEVVVRGRGG